MRKKPGKMTEEQYQLGIRQMSPHQKVTMIVRYRGLIQELTSSLHQIILSEQCDMTAMQAMLLNDLISTSNKWTTDYTHVLNGEEE
jgi:hypothetical protein